MRYLICKIAIGLIICLEYNLSFGQYVYQLQKLDEYIENARKQWEVPGLSVVVIKNGETVFSHGYGERKLGTGQKVNTKTIFAICSTTKAMTAASMAMLVDEGKISWDDRVIDHMPDFQLYDPYVTRELKVRDLFTHNSGVGNADLLWAMWEYPMKEIFRRMKYLEPSYSFRGGYTYQNIMYAAAGELIGRISGIPWKEFIQKRIFDPLGMTNSYPTLELSQIQTNRSVPHHFVDGKVTPIFDRSADPIAPAGSIWSCTEDMQKWMKFMLDSARVDGKRLISAKNFHELLKPQAMVTESGFYPTQSLTHPHWRTYALGWFQHDYRGRAVSFHTGSLQGTVAIIGLIPDEKLGVYVLGNLDHAEVRHAIMYKVFDVFSEKDQNRDWSTDFLELYSSIREQGEKRYEDQLAKGVEGTNPSYPLEKYVGIYSNRFLGDIQISLDHNKLRAVLGQDEVELEHFHFDTFLIKWTAYPWRNDGFLNFEVDGSGDLGLEIFGYEFSKK